MPYSVKKQDCKQSSGKKGAYIVIKKNTGGKTSCHSSKEKAKDSIAARHAKGVVEEIMEEVLQEIKDYFRNQQDEDYLACIYRILYANHSFLFLASLISFSGRKYPGFIIYNNWKLPRIFLSEMELQWIKKQN